MLTNFLLCVIIVQLGYITGEIAGKQPEMEKRPWRSLITVVSVLTSLTIGAVLYFTALVIARAMEGLL